MPSLLLQWTFDSNTQSWILQSGLAVQFSSTDGSPTAGSIFRTYSGNNFTFTDRFQSPLIDWASLLPVGPEAITSIRMKSMIKFVDNDGRLQNSSFRLYCTIGGVEVTGPSHGNPNGPIPWTEITDTIPMNLSSLGTGRMQVGFQGTISGGGGRSATPYADTIEVEVFYETDDKEGSFVISEPVNISLTGEKYEPKHATGTVTISEKTNINITTDSWQPPTADIVISEKAEIKISSTVKYGTPPEETTKTVVWTFDNNLDGWYMTEGDMYSVTWTGDDGNPPGSLDVTSSMTIIPSTTLRSPWLDFETLGIPLDKIIYKVDISSQYIRVAGAVNTIAIGVVTKDPNKIYTKSSTTFFPTTWGYQLVRFDATNMEFISSSTSFLLEIRIADLDGILRIDNPTIKVYYEGDGSQVHRVYKDLTISEPVNMTVTGNKMDMGDNYVGSVTITEPVNISLSGTKMTEKRINITEQSELLFILKKGIQGPILLEIFSTVLKTSMRGTNFALIIENPVNMTKSGIKSILYDKTIIIPVNMNFIQSKGTGSGIVISEFPLLTFEYRKTLIGLDKEGSILISEPYNISIQGQKRIRAPTEIGEATNITFEGSKETAKSLTISNPVSMTESGHKTGTGSVTISNPVAVTESGTKASGSELLVSHKVNVIIEARDDSTTDFVGSVVISEKVNILSTVTKHTESNIEIEEGSEITFAGSKHRGSNIEIEEGSEITFAGSKSGNNNIIISEKVVITVTGAESTIYDFAGSIEIDETVVIGMSGNRGHSKYLKITEYSIIPISGTKASNKDLTISETVNIIISFRLPYVLLSPEISHIERKWIINMDERSGTVYVLERGAQTEVILLALSKNTVRLKVEFRDFDGELISPDNVVLRIYKWDREQIGVDIPVNPSEIGVFQHDYELPDSPDESLYFEFEGVMGGNPVIARDKISVVWVN